MADKNVVAKMFTEFVRSEPKQRGLAFMKFLKGLSDLKAQTQGGAKNE